MLVTEEGSASGRLLFPGLQGMCAAYQRFGAFERDKEMLREEKRAAALGKFSVQRPYAGPWNLLADLMTRRGPWHLIVRQSREQVGPLDGRRR